MAEPLSGASARMAANQFQQPRASKGRRERARFGPGQDVLRSHRTENEGPELHLLRAAPLAELTSWSTLKVSAPLFVIFGFFCISGDIDTLAERLRRRPANPTGSPRVGSNPTGVVLILFSFVARSPQGPLEPVNLLPASF